MQQPQRNRLFSHPFNRFTETRGRWRLGFTLVELMIVVAIIGVLAALAIYGVRLYIASSKTSEAKQTVGAIARAGALAYEKETAASALLPLGTESTGVQHKLCETSTKVPADFSKVQGKKYQPLTGAGQDFNWGTGTKGWACIKFTMSQPISYQYQYVWGNPGGPVFGTKCGQGNDAFYATAKGDLDGNHKGSGWDNVSTFSRCGQINATTKALVMSTQIFTRQETE